MLRLRVQMRIYTKTGDDGSTGLFGGARVQKDAARVDAYGTVDELNSVLGLARAHAPEAEIDELLARLQDDLFCLGAELACQPGSEDRLSSRRLGDNEVAALEAAIDHAEAPLPPLRHFVLPGGTPAAAALHQARTVCRRAERSTLATSRNEPVRRELLIYLNRLSDLLFVLARRENQLAGRSDVLWIPRAR